MPNEYDKVVGHVGGAFDLNHLKPHNSDINFSAEVVSAILSTHQACAPHFAQLDNIASMLQSGVTPTQEVITDFTTAALILSSALHGLACAAQMIHNRYTTHTPSVPEGK